MDTGLRRHDEQERPQRRIVTNVMLAEAGIQF